MDLRKLGRIAAVLLCCASPLGARADRQQGGMSSYRSSGPDMSFWLIGMSEVRKELSLTEEQNRQLRQVMLDHQARAGELFRGIQNLSPDERFKRMAQFHQEGNRRLRGILTDRQTERLDQLILQRAGIRALARPDVQDDMKLSADQRERVRETFENERSSFPGAMGSFRPREQLTAEERNKIREKFSEVRRSTDAKLHAILTDGQREHFQRLQGAPFRFPDWHRHRPRGK